GGASHRIPRTQPSGCGRVSAPVPRRSAARAPARAGRGHLDRRRRKMGRTLVEREDTPRGARLGAPPDLTIGVVGPHDLVERVMLMGHNSAPVPCRLVAAAYRDEQEAADKVLRLGPSVDACLFASPVPFELARRAGVLTMPATHVQLSGAALIAALGRAAL